MSCCNETGASPEQKMSNWLWRMRKLLEWHDKARDYNAVRKDIIQLLDEANLIVGS